MTDFKKYQHVERLENEEVAGLLEGTVYLFAKLDGTNASIWTQDGHIKLGSRNREVTAEADNQGFYAWFHDGGPSQLALSELLKANPSLVVYGEWLVPHTFKGYYDTAWRRFWAFDVFDTAQGRYLAYEEYSELFDRYGLDCYVPCAAKLENPTAREVGEHAADASKFLVRDNMPGEGVVVKRYDFVNQWGNVKWGKVVLSEFLEHKKKTKTVRVAEGETLERAMVEDFLTEAMVDKTIAKICAEHGTGWRQEYIGQLLGTVWHEFFVEELWNAVKKHKVRGDLNIGRLNTEVILRTKQLKPAHF